MERQEQYHIIAFIKGNRTSFRWVFDRYKTPLYSYVHSLLKSDKWTEDICSEVFISIWENREKIHPETFESYVFQIARNRVFNKLKKVAADSRQEEEYLRRYRESTARTDEMEEVVQARRVLLEEEIQNLPPRRKEILQRKYFHGQANTQIAKDMGISINTVKVHLYKAHLFLRSRLGKR